MQPPVNQLQILVEGAPPLTLGHDQLFFAPRASRVEDIGALVPGRSGGGVRFSWLAAQARLPEGLGWVTLESTDGRFAASLEMEDLGAAIVVHADGARPFGSADGGPFRLYIPGANDACGNVKHLGRITFSSKPGADTRPPESERTC